VDRHTPKPVRREELLTKCGWSPFEGWELVGWPPFPPRTLVRGYQAIPLCRSRTVARGGGAGLSNLVGG